MFSLREQVRNKTKSADLGLDVLYYARKGLWFSELPTIQRGRKIRNAKKDHPS